MKITLNLYPELSACSVGLSCLVGYFSEGLSTEFEDVIIPGLGVPVITVIGTDLCAICSEVQVVTTEITSLWKFNKLPCYTISNASGIIFSKGKKAYSQYLSVKVHVMLVALITLCTMRVILL